MRHKFHLLALIIAVPLLITTTPMANAGLVEDLRSGRADIETLSNGQASRITGISRNYKVIKTKPEHKAMAVQAVFPYGVRSAWGHRSAAAAVQAAMSLCEKTWGGGCQLYSVNSQVVQGYTQRKLANVIAKFDGFNKNTNDTAHNSIASSSVVYCRREDGSVYRRRPGLACQTGREITKAEYNRLREFEAGAIYCRRGDGSVYRYVKRDNRAATCGENAEISRTAFNRLSGGKMVSANKPNTVTGPRQLYCRRDDGSVYRSYRHCGNFREITKAEYERITGRHTAAASVAYFPDLEILDAPYVTLKEANVREAPDIDSIRVKTLAKGAEVTALAKVRDSNWYLISRDGERLGYVFGSLIAEAEALVALPPAARNPNAVAVIVGNRNYDRRIPAVDFAHNDADAIKVFFTDRLGYDPDNIIDLRDATKAKVEATFGNERTHQGKLWSYLDVQGGSDVMIYYSGHGVPGQKDGKGYLLPTDADPDHPEINGYPLDMLYANLAKLEARSITVLLDACFSGGSHGGTLIRAASSILVSPKKIHAASGGVVVLTAASGDQLASWDEQAEQGLFTHYFLEAVYGAADADADGAVDLAEIKTYLDRTMTRRARRDFLREQEAWVSGAPETVLVQLGSQE